MDEVKKKKKIGRRRIHMYRWGGVRGEDARDAGPLAKLFGRQPRPQQRPGLYTLDTLTNAGTSLTAVATDDGQRRGGRRRDGAKSRAERRRRRPCGMRGGGGGGILATTPSVPSPLLFSDWSTCRRESGENERANEKGVPQCTCTHAHTQTPKNKRNIFINIYLSPPLSLIILCYMYFSQQKMCNRRKKKICATAYHSICNGLVSKYPTGVLYLD
jgi:hypothetical protein